MNDAQYNTTALSVISLHDALLYFDYVIPVTGTLEVGWAIAMERRNDPNKYSHEEMLEIIKNLVFGVLPDHLRNDTFTSKLNEFYGFTTALFNKQAEEFLAGRPLHFEPDALAPYQQFVDDYRLYEYPMCTLPQFASELEPRADDLSLTIASLQLINTAATPLKQLLEFRRDPEAKLKLRRFRLFAYENYVGKSPTFVEDDIQSRLAEYNTVVKKWGFETTAATFTALVDSDLIKGGIAGSFLSSYLHQPTLAAASALLATGVTIGKIAIEVGKRRFALRELASGSPVSYVSYAKEKLESPDHSGQIRIHRYI